MSDVMCSMFLIALGVNIEIRAGVLMLAIDGLVLAISKTFKIEFGKVKVASDCTQVAIAVIASLLLTHRLQGVREGTVAAAVFVGIIINKVYNHKLGWIFEKIGLTPMVREKETQEEEVLAGEAPLHVITIAREVGSGGYEIGKILGERLHMPVYNKEDSAGSGAENGGERALYHHRTSGQLLSGTSAGMFPCIYPWGEILPDPAFPGRESYDAGSGPGRIRAQRFRAEAPLQILYWNELRRISEL